MIGLSLCTAMRPSEYDSWPGVGDDLRRGLRDLREVFLERLRRQLVKLLSLALQERLVLGVLNQRVLEGVMRLWPSSLSKIRPRQPFAAPANSGGAAH